jgi:DNA/RNA-binding domain of Phe-tRNA-synthetase-like protein
LEETDLRAAPGFIESRVHEEFPGLRLDWVSVEGRGGTSPPSVASQLKQLSNRFRGADVVAMRTRPIPHAYRSFFRQIGLDPDTNRVPVEQAAVDRLMHGGFRSIGLVEDALLIGLVETGVPVWALDADQVDAGGLGIRTTVAGDRLGTTELGNYLPPGQLAVADARCVHSLLFDEPALGHGVTRASSRITLFAVSVPGVPAIHVEEALWVTIEVLRSGSER